MIPPLVAGVLAGAVTVLMWVRYELGKGTYDAWGAALVALGIAWAVALAGGRRRGPKLQLLAMGLTAAAMAIGQYLVVHALIGRLLRDSHGQMQIGWWDAAAKLWSPRDALFFVVGLAFAGFVPHRRAPAPQREGLK